VSSTITLLSTDFDGTLVEHGSDPVFDSRCLAMIGELQKQGAVWAINTGRSVDLLESGLADFDFPVRPDYILTSERDVFRPCSNGGKWEAFGDWNDRVAREHRELFTSAASVLDDVLQFVTQKTRARVIRDHRGVEGLIAQDEAEMERIARFIDEARQQQPKFHYQRNTVYLRFCHSDYHKGAALAELSRLLEIPRENIFAAGDHHNDVSMLDGRFAALTACPSNAIDEVKQTVRNSGGFVAESCCGAGVYEALLYYTS
jgi:HAD superfamily hydrolase (TIGR01484 family)